MKYRDYIRMSVEENIKSYDEIRSNLLKLSIEENEIQEDIEDDMKEMHEISDAMDDNEIITSTIEDQIDTNNELIDNNPNNITDEVITASNETFNYIIGRLGLDKDTYCKKIKISSESNPSNIDKLVVSTEGLVNVLKDFIIYIKNLIIRFIQAFKRFIARMAMWLSNKHNSIINLRMLCTQHPAVKIENVDMKILRKFVKKFNIILSACDDKLNISTILKRGIFNDSGLLINELGKLNKHLYVESIDLENYNKDFNNIKNIFINKEPDKYYVEFLKKNNVDTENMLSIISAKGDTIAVLCKYPTTEKDVFGLNLSKVTYDNSITRDIDISSIENKTLNDIVPDINLLMKYVNDSSKFFNELNRNIKIAYDKVKQSENQILKNAEEGLNKAVRRKMSTTILKNLRDVGTKSVLHQSYQYLYVVNTLTWLFKAIIYNTGVK